MAIEHSNLNSIHKFAYVQPNDPGAIGAYKGWVDTSGGEPYILKVRNAANTGWNTIGSSGSGGAPSGAAGGVLSGTYPNPSFLQDMATQDELNALISTIGQKEVTANKSTDGTFSANSDTLYPSQKAVKTYVDANIGGGGGGGTDLVTLADYDGTLAGAVSAIALAGNPPVILSITSPITVSSNITVPSNIHLEPRALITVAAGTTLTIGSMVNVGNRKIFNTSASNANVRFAKGAVKEFNVAWWAGSDTSSGALDITDAINEALASAVTNANGGIVYIPSGHYTTRGQHYIGDSTTIKGDGNFATAGYGGTVVKLTSPLDTFMFRIGGGEFCTRFRDIVLDGVGTTSKSAILLEGTYPASSADLDIERTTIGGFDIGLNYNDVEVGTNVEWQFAQVRISQTIFHSNRIGVRASSLNSEFAFESVNFVVPDGSTARAVHALGMGITNFKSCEFAGVNGVASATTGNAIIEIDGAHVAINFIGCQDENIQYFLINDASDITGIVNLYGNLIQSELRINQSMVLNSVGNNYIPDAIYIAPGALPHIFSQNDNIRTDIGTRTAPGTVPANPLRLVQSDSPLTQFEFNPVLGYGSGGAIDAGLKVRHLTNFIAPDYMSAQTSLPLVGIGDEPTGTGSKVLLRLGRRVLGAHIGFDNYYDFRRGNTGDDYGRLIIEGNETAFRGYNFNADAYFEGSLRTKAYALTDGATILINPVGGNHQYVTLGGNRTLAANPMSAANQTKTDGMRMTIEIIQDGTGSRTLALNTGAGQFAFGTDITGITLSTAAGATDLLTVVYSKRKDRWLVTDFKKGY